MRSNAAADDYAGMIPCVAGNLLEVGSEQGENRKPFTEITDISQIT